MASQILFKNPKSNINIPDKHVTTELVSFRKSFEAGQFYINLWSGSSTSFRERITEVASAQASMMWNKQPMGLQWKICCLISAALIVGSGMISPEQSALKLLWTLWSSVADTEWLSQIMLRTVHSEFPMFFTHKKVRIPVLENVNGLIYHWIKAAL